MHSRISSTDPHTNLFRLRPQIQRCCRSSRSSTSRSPPTFPSAFRRVSSPSRAPAAPSPRLAFLPSRTIRSALFDTAEAAAAARTASDSSSKMWMTEDGQARQEAQRLPFPTGTDYGDAAAIALEQTGTWPPCIVGPLHLRTWRIAGPEPKDTAGPTRRSNSRRWKEAGRSVVGKRIWAWPRLSVGMADCSDYSSGRLTRQRSSPVGFRYQPSLLLQLLLLLLRTSIRPRQPVPSHRPTLGS